MRREVTVVVLCVLALTCLGVLMVYSTTAVDDAQGGLVKRHAVFVCLGLFVMFFVAHLDYHRLTTPWVFRTIILSTIGLLLLVLTPGIGVSVNGAQRWINLFGFGFQPSEVAKFTLILWLAVKLSRNQEHRQQLFKGYFPPMVIAAFLAGLVCLERDLGVPALMMGVAFTMMLVAGINLYYLAASVVPGVVALAALVLAAPYRVRRMTSFLDPWQDPLGDGFNLIQSLSAFAQGGAFGRGPGASEQKLGYLFASHTDFIFSVVGEEMGLAGTLAVVLAFILFVWAGMAIARNAQDLLGTLLASGITALVGGQAAFIMAVNTGMVPTKGLPLPFISYGGTAIVVFLGACGVLVNVGLQARAAEPEARPRLIPLPAGARR